RVPAHHDEQRGRRPRPRLRGVPDRAEPGGEGQPRHDRGRAGDRPGTDPDRPRDERGDGRV
ncbi:MAG: hypothetical protein AVDCRST_MAG52-2137, partial [uncultured Blastococcus sp.]